MLVFSFISNKIGSVVVKAQDLQADTQSSNPAAANFAGFFGIIDNLSKFKMLINHFS